MNKSKAFSYIGLGVKSANVVCGEFMTEKAVKEGKACLVIIAEDCSDNTKKKFTNMCDFYEVPLYVFATKEELGHAMGKEMRASLAFIDQGLARAVEKQLL